LVDPGLLDKASVAWVLDMIRFQYEYRQAIFQFKHWIHMTKSNPSEQWNRRYERRRILDDVYSAAVDIIERRRPASINQALRDRLFCEPALWVRPARPCVWVPDFKRLTAKKDSVTLTDQLPSLWEEEPIRSEWTVSFARFAELLPTYHAEALADHPTRCWILPGEYGEEDYRPTPIDRQSFGSPGAQFYTAPHLPPAWEVAKNQLMNAVATGSDSLAFIFPEVEVKYPDSFSRKEPQYAKRTAPVRGSTKKAGQTKTSTPKKSRVAQSSRRDSTASADQRKVGGVKKTGPPIVDDSEDEESEGTDAVDQ
jgi:hypothetical protein